MNFLKISIIIPFIIGLSYSSSVFTQNNLTGQWQGMMKQNGTNEVSILYLELIQNDEIITGFTKQEFPNTNNYVYYSVIGNKKNELIQKNPLSKKLNSNQLNCKYDYVLTYDSSTGYLEGQFTSSTCRGVQGEVKLYRSETKQDLSEKKPSSQVWFDAFLNDVKKGRKSPEVRALERKNFKFRPIYFEYDRDEINEKDYEYLKEMARIVDGHSDLRIKITGHTDGDGSDQYNDLLSKRRAKAIKDFFLKCNVEDFKLVIDYKGKRMPVGDNRTPEGMHDNRRVDFKFI